jgi:hypothetical protein
MNNKTFSIILLTIIVADSVVTSIVGEEVNPIVLWLMKTFDLSLNGFLIWKVIISGALIYWLSKQYYSYVKFATYSYIGIYTFFVGIQFLILGMR